MIKFDKIEPGMKLWDVHTYTMGNTTMKALGSWEVLVKSVDRETRTAVVSWNGNAPETWRESRLRGLYAKITPKQQERIERERRRWR